MKKFCNPPMKIEKSKKSNPHISATMQRPVSNSLKYQRFTPSGYKDKGITKFEFRTDSTKFCMCLDNQNKEDTKRPKSYKIISKI